MKKTLAISLSLLIASPAYPMEGGSSESQTSSFKKYGAYAPVAAVGTAALAGLAYLGNRWWQGEPSAKMNERGNKIYADLLAKKKQLKRYNPSMVQSVSESDLEKIAASSEPTILLMAQADKKQLDAMKVAIDKRIVRDGSKGLPIIDMLRDLSNKIAELSQEYEQIAQFWADHGGYFNAKSALLKAESRYSKVRKQPTSKKEIRKAVMATGVQFPFVHYERSLRYDLQDISRAIQLSINYPRLHSQAQLMRDDLQEILATLVSLHEYTSDRRMKQEYEAEQRRLQIERERLKAERDRIFAQQISAAFNEIARAIEQNRIKEQHAKNAAEKARLERERKELEQKKAELEKQKQDVQRPATPAQQPQSTNYPGLYPTYDQQDGEFVNPVPSAPPAQPSGNYAGLQGINLYDPSQFTPSAPPETGDEDKK